MLPEVRQRQTLFNLTLLQCLNKLVEKRIRFFVVPGVGAGEIGEDGPDLDFHLQDKLAPRMSCSARWLWIALLRVSLESW